MVIAPPKRVSQNKYHLVPGHLIHGFPLRPPYATFPIAESAPPRRFRWVHSCRVWVISGRGFGGAMFGSEHRFSFAPCSFLRRNFSGFGQTRNCLGQLQQYCFEPLSLRTLLCGTVANTICTLCGSAIPREADIQRP